MSSFRFCGGAEVSIFLMGKGGVIFYSHFYAVFHSQQGPKTSGLLLSLRLSRFFDRGQFAGSREAEHYGDLC